MMRDDKQVCYQYPSKSHAERHKTVENDYKIQNLFETTQSSSITRDNLNWNMWTQTNFNNATNPNPQVMHYGEEQNGLSLCSSNPHQCDAGFGYRYIHHHPYGHHQPQFNLPQMPRQTDFTQPKTLSAQTHGHQNSVPSTSFIQNPTFEDWNHKNSSPHNLSNNIPPFKIGDTQTHDIAMEHQHSNFISFVNPNGNNLVVREPPPPFCHSPISSDGISGSESPNTGNQMHSPIEVQQSRLNTDESLNGWTKTSDSQEQHNHSGKTRTRDKYRVVYSDFQRIALEKEFHYSRYITMKRKSELSQLFGLSERQVKIWFQNRRAKERKQVKKQEEFMRKEKDVGNVHHSHQHQQILPNVNWQ